MNEGFEKEIEAIALLNQDKCDYYIVKGIAEYFYNLALKDVKKEIESKLDVPNRKVKWREKHELEPDYNVRVCVLLKDILDSIEKQKV